MFMFGLVTALQGLVQNYSGILATRFFLGLFEAGKLFPLAYLRCYSEDVCADFCEKACSRDVST